MFFCLTEFDLDDETFRALWNEFQTGGGIEYDEFVAVLAKLLVLKGKLWLYLGYFRVQILNIRLPSQQISKHTCRVCRVTAKWPPSLSNRYV